MTPSLLALIALPGVLALVLPLVGRWPNIREAMSLLTGGVLLAGVASWIAPVMAGARESITLLEMVPGISISFTLEPLGLLFALVASCLWIVTTVYALGYMRGNNEAHQTRFFVCFALAIFAAIGVAFSGNLVTLFIFYEILTLSTYPLVTHKGTDTARNGGRVYLGVLLTTSIGFLLPAIIITWVVAGTIDFTLGGVLEGNLRPGLAALLFALFLFGVGKAALMPFHRWLPAAMVAPTPVSALLHAVAVVKVGVFSVLKITVYIFGIDFAESGGFTQPMMWVAAFTVLAASVVALRKDNLKARLAYSTVSQLAYIVLGATLATRLGIVGGAMHIVTHAFGKITLFFCAGAIYTALHKTLVSELDGLGRVMPFTFVAFAIASLSIIGLPPLGGMWSKWYLMSSAAATGELFLIAILAISSLLNIVYLLEIPLRGFLFASPRPYTPGVQEAPLACVLPLCATAAGCVVLFVFPEPLLALLAPWTST